MHINSQGIRLRCEVLAVHGVHRKFLGSPSPIGPRHVSVTRTGRSLNASSSGKVKLTLSFAACPPSSPGAVITFPLLVTICMCSSGVRSGLSCAPVKVKSSSAPIRAPSLRRAAGALPRDDRELLVGMAQPSHAPNQRDGWREPIFSSCTRRQFSCHFRQFPFAPFFDSLKAVISTNGSLQRFPVGLKDV